MRPVVSLRSVRLLVCAATTAAVMAALAPTRAEAQVAFHGIGDLPGGPFWSQVRDATKVDGIIYAVGGAAARTQILCVGVNNPPGCNTFSIGADTAILWRLEAGAGSLTALPNLVVNTSAVSFVTASAITPDGQYIAGRARSVSSGGAVLAVRQTTALVPFPSANLNLANLFSPSLAANNAATAISNDGTVLYGFGSNGTLAVRFDTVSGSSTIIPLLDGMARNNVAARGTSASGAVAVGITAGGGQQWGYRYVHGTGSATIPRLAGGGWNQAVAVSPDGNLVLLAGNSAAYPQGEMYLYNATSGATTPLGSPNRPWTPDSTVGGMTADGSVIAVAFSGPTRAFPYFRNSHGWFLVASALAAGGIDIKAQGWTELSVFGMSSDGTLVFGQGVHDGQREGYVAEFPAGYLAGFNPQPVAPSSTSIVGAWHVNDSESGSSAVIVFMADGTYYLIQPTVQASEESAAPGFERGLYTWDSVTGAFRVTTLNDTNGDAGLSDDNGRLNGTLFVAGDTISREAGGAAIATRITAPEGTALKDTLAGGWVVGSPAAADASAVVVFDTDGTYYYAQDGPIEAGGHDGVEKGTFSWDPDPLSHVLSATAISVDTNGDWGLSDPSGPISLVPFVDGLAATVDDTTGPLPLRRVIDPDTVVPVITSPAGAAGTYSVPFSYTVEATFAPSQFEASGLPGGLSIDTATGVISGTPVSFGSFTVELSASNTLRTGTATLALVIAPPNTSTGSGVSVEPDVPPGGNPVSVTFSSVAAAGETTVTTVDPDTAPEPPTGFQLGPVYYEISTTADFTGPVTVCFSYAGVATGTPRLFHYEGGEWKDITTSVDTATQTICGQTTSFSPFAVFVSPVTRTGFYAPVSPVAGFVNTVKGGSTVPLKFDVYVDGVEKTDTRDLEFSVTQVGCDAAAEDPLDFVATGGTSLRYDAAAGHFVQNWQTPKAAGLCFVVKMTTTADGLSLSATFRTK